MSYRVTDIYYLWHGSRIIIVLWKYAVKQITLRSGVYADDHHGAPLTFHGFDILWSMCMWFPCQSRLLLWALSLWTPLWHHNG